jgi:hypothetical protein
MIPTATLDECILKRRASSYVRCCSQHLTVRSRICAESMLPMAEWTVPPWRHRAGRLARRFTRLTPISSWIAKSAGDLH